MKIASTTYRKYKIFIVTICVFVGTQLLLLSSAHAQIDFYYGKNTKGFRIGGGPAVTNLFTQYSSFPFSFAFVADIDYAFNPYFSVGVNGQYGQLLGADNSNTFYLQQSLDTYSYYNLNMKAGVGLISDFSPRNRLQDALKRFYVGLGYGNISTNNVITITTNRKLTSASVIPDDNNPFKNLDNNYGGHPTAPKLSSSGIPMYVLDLGTYIDMPGLWGTDKVEICPNYQINYTSQPYLDGFKSGPKDINGGIFIITSVTLRYKF